VPTQIVLLSDTHLPKRAKRLPTALWDAIDRADIVVHAGDWVTVDLLDELQARSNRLVGVRGNNDGPEFADRLPEVASFDVDGLRFAVVHETGSSVGRERRMLDAYPDTDVLVFGHSHIPWDTTASAPDTTASAPGTTASAPDTTGPGGERRLRLLNPGSPTDRRRQPDFTWMTGMVDRGTLTIDLVRLHPSPPEAPRR
jgi:putative phosphoesterase